MKASSLCRISKNLKPSMFWDSMGCSFQGGPWKRHHYPLSASKEDHYQIEYHYRKENHYRTSTTGSLEHFSFKENRARFWFNFVTRPRLFWIKGLIWEPYFFSQCGSSKSFNATFSRPSFYPMAGFANKSSPCCPHDRCTFSNLGE